ncbi:MAG: hypothetical protein ACXACG_12760, partial [Candidatus Thorarchaeota archaeon]
GMEKVITKNLRADDVSKVLKRWGAAYAHIENAVKVSRGFPRESGQVWPIIWTQTEEWRAVI